MAKSYDFDTVKSALAGSSEITFLDVSLYSDGNIAKIEAETFALTNGTFRGDPLSTLRLIPGDTKKRQKRTLEKFGITREEVRAGLPSEEIATAVSEYFRLHPGVIAGYGAAESVRLINRLSQDVPPVCNKTLDVRAMAVYCREDHGAGGIRDAEKVLSACMSVYRRLKKAELNKIPCVLKRASYWEHENGLFRKEYLFFHTSVGTIYFDPFRQRWDMSAKERERTGLVIENFDVENIAEQAFRKYRARDLDDLENRLREYEKARAV